MARSIQRHELDIYSKYSLWWRTIRGRRTCLVFVTGVLLLVGGLSCSQHVAEPHYPNVVLISIDTLRRDHCSVHGYSLPTTPVMRELGKQGAVFDLAYAPIATTAPSHATMLTGYYPLAHRLIKNGLTLDDEFETLPELLAPYGYQSYAVVSAFVLDRKFGLAQGFDEYDDRIPLEETSWKKSDFQGQRVPRVPDRRSDFTSDRAIQWLRTRRDPQRPFFMFVHYFAPHYPYVPPPEVAASFVPPDATRHSHEEAVGLYDAEIAFADASIGRLLDELKTLQIDEDTIVVLTADHGEGLKQHGWMFHGIHIYEEAVRVPLIFRFPQQISPGQVFDQPVELTDLTPTILALADIDMPYELFQGMNLAPALRRQSDLDANRAVYLHRRHYNGDYLGEYWAKGELFGIRDREWKYIEGKEENLRQLFNLAKDPLETTNVLDEFPEAATQLAHQLESWKLDQHSAKPIRNEMTNEDIEKLRSLGYIQ